MFRVGLVYFDVDNLGDLVIYDTAKFLVEENLDRHDLDDYVLTSIDIGSENQRRYSMSFSQKQAARRAKKKVSSPAFAAKSDEEKKTLLLNSWHKSRAYLWFAKEELPKFQNLDIVIFCGGGIVKFHKQNFHYYLHEILQLCDEKGIPVIINSTGVEGYDGDDPKCQILKAAINRDCVKYISTRDDLETLTAGYITNPNIKVEAVCDPALWIRECYGIQACEQSNTVGLGVIRPNIFKEYMYYVNRDFLVDMYFALAKRLCEAGYHVEFFCNGSKKDADFINVILAKYPSLKKQYGVTKKVPISPRELVKTIAGYDRIMAVRLHASIIATTLGIPNVSLVWNVKQPLFGQQTGLADNYLTKEQFDDLLIFDKLVNLEKPKIKDTYRNSVLTGLGCAITANLKTQDSK